MTTAIYADTPIAERLMQETLSRIGKSAAIHPNIKGQIDLAVTVYTNVRPNFPASDANRQLDICLSSKSQDDLLNKGTLLFFQTPVRMGYLADQILRWEGSARNGGSDSTYEIGSYTLNAIDNTITSKQGVTRLTGKEKDILVALLTAPGHTLSRQSLMDVVWAYADGVETHTLETHIYRLRQKIEKDPSDPKILITLPDGYSIKV